MSQLKFNLQESAPTSEAINAALKQARFRQNAIPMGWGAATVFSIYLGNEHSLFIFTALISVLGLIVSFGRWMDDDWTNSYSPLSDRYCADLTQHCRATQETRAYKDSVIAQARQFTYGEYQMLKKAAETEEAMKGYRALYRLPSDALVP